MESGNGNRAPLGWDLRTIVFLLVALAWTASVLAGIVNGAEIPIYVHGAMLAVIGYFVGDRIRRGMS